MVPKVLFLCMRIKLPLSPAVNVKKNCKIPTAFVKNKYPLGLEFGNVVFANFEKPYYLEKSSE
jgi:hypothetical protein